MGPCSPVKSLTAPSSVDKLLDKKSGKNLRSAKSSKLRIEEVNLTYTNLGTGLTWQTEAEDHWSQRQDPSRSFSFSSTSIQSQFTTLRSQFDSIWWCLQRKDSDSNEIELNFAIKEEGSCISRHGIGYWVTTRILYATKLSTLRAEIEGRDNDVSYWRVTEPGLNNKHN